MPLANDKQIGGDHYRKTDGEQHWDRHARMYGAGYFIGCATGYIERCLEKGHAVEDLEKAAHFCQKLAELIKAGIIKPNNTEDPHCHPQDVPIAQAIPKTRQIDDAALERLSTGRETHRDIEALTTALDQQGH